MYRTMKKQNFHVLLASVMLVAMTFASCKSSNKPVTEASRIGEIPEAAQDIVGLEKYNTVNGFFFNNLKQNIADRIKAFMEKNSNDK